MSSSTPLRALALGVTIFCSACAIPAYEPAAGVCPPWPVGGPFVAAELERLPAEEYPATWEWLGRLSQLRDQLETCR